MADEQNTTQSINDDQELAKVLAGVSTQIDSNTPEPVIETTQAPEPQPVEEPAAQAAQPQQDNVPSQAQANDTPQTSNTETSDLDSIKTDALKELRPLVDKLDVSPEEKFDTYLLLLRSTDDKELIEPAHEAAKNISDEARRAQALLDIIKEIDFLSQNQK